MHLPVTERHQAEEALIRARREAEAANTAKSRFLAAVSHDLRQPVQAAMLFYHLLPVDLDSGGPGNVYRRLGQQLEAMQDMLNRLLDVSKLEAGLVDASIRAFPVREMFDRLRGDFNQIVGDRPVQLRMVDCAAWVRTDPELLHLILHNVLSNAIDHTPRGVILVGCRRRGADIRIQVCDTGGGIPESDLPFVFEEFYQANNPNRDRRKGLGLGLAIVKRLARLLGHPIGLRSTAGRGTMFEIMVPAAAAGAPARAAAEAGATVAKPEPEPLGRTIVLIEDDPDVLEAIRLVLETAGHAVVAAPGLAGALDALRALDQAPDAILADYRLESGATGSEAIRRLRQEFGPGIPGILLTGDTSPDRLREAENNGFRLLHKPVGPQELQQVVESML
jgi:two-component system CheB/CheR fusion protein